MKDIFVLGGGGHARVLIHGLRRLGYHVRGYTALHDEGELLGVPYLGTDDELDDSRADFPPLAALGVGKVTVHTERLELIDRLESRGVGCPVIFTLAATVHDDVRVGAGSVVLDGAVVVTGSRLGRACIVNTRASVDHDCVLGDDVHVASGATLSGGVVVGDHCMIGTGANLIQAVTVCADCMIGAGATVVDDIITPGTYVGVPARRVS